MTPGKELLILSSLILPYAWIELKCISKNEHCRPSSASLLSFLSQLENSRNGKLQSIVLWQVILVASEATVFYT